MKNRKRNKYGVAVVVRSVPLVLCCSDLAFSSAALTVESISVNPHTHDSSFSLHSDPCDTTLFLGHRRETNHEENGTSYAAQRGFTLG